MKNAFLCAISMLVLAQAMHGQTFSLDDFIKADDYNLPQAALKDPFPWGFEPGLRILDGAKGPVESITVKGTFYGWKFGERTITGTSERKYRVGEAPGEWECDDGSAVWREGESRHYFSSPDYENAHEYIVWTGPWNAPATLEEKSDMESAVQSSWKKMKDRENCWEVSRSDGTSQVWKRTENALSTVWTSYTGDGEAERRLSIKRNAKGSPISIEYWTDPQTRHLAVELTKTDNSALITGSIDGKPSLEISFSKGGLPIAKSSGINGSYRISEAFSYDSGGLLAGIIRSSDHFSSKLEIERDRAGNIVKTTDFSMDDDFGGKEYREFYVQTRQIAYRLAGESGKPIARPAGLDEWLKGGSTPESRGDWHTSSYKDPLTDQTTHYCMLWSDDKAESHLETISLCLRKNMWGLESYVSFDTMLDEDYSLGLRFDDDPPIFLGKGEWSRSTDMTAAFINKYSLEEQSHTLVDLAGLMMAKRTLYVQATGYGGKTIGATFRLGGLEAAIRKLMPLEEFLVDNDPSWGR